MTQAQTQEALQEALQEVRRQAYASLQLQEKFGAPVLPNTVAPAVVITLLDHIAMLEVGLNGANERVQIMLTHKNRWRDRAINLEAELAQLRQAKDSLRAALADIASGEILRSHCTGPHCVEELGAATADDMASRAAGALEWDDRLLAASPTPPARKGVSDEEIKSIYYSVIGAEASQAKGED